MNYNWDLILPLHSFWLKNLHGWFFVASICWILSRISKKRFGAKITHFLFKLWFQERYATFFCVVVGNCLLPKDFRWHWTVWNAGLKALICKQDFTRLRVLRLYEKNQTMYFHQTGSVRLFCKVDCFHTWFRELARIIGSFHSSSGSWWTLGKNPQFPIIFYLQYLIFCQFKTIRTFPPLASKLSVFDGI